MVKPQEAENQLVIDYEVYDQRPSDLDTLVPAINIHRGKLGRAPRLVTAHGAFYSTKNEGVQRICIPNRNATGAERKLEQRKHWFGNGQKWRTGCKGRIGVAKRRHGLDRRRYKGSVGNATLGRLGVIADNLFNTDCAMQNSSCEP